MVLVLPRVISRRARGMVINHSQRPTNRPPDRCAGLSVRPTAKVRAPWWTTWRC